MTQQRRFDTGQLQPGQRVRYTGTRYTGRVTREWQGPGGHQAGFGTVRWLEITMDSQYSPPPTPVRYHVTGEDKFEPLPDDYLSDAEALTAIERIFTMPSGLNGAAKTGLRLANMAAVLRRNGRLGEGEGE